MTDALNLRIIHIDVFLCPTRVKKNKSQLTTYSRLLHFNIIVVNRTAFE